MNENKGTIEILEVLFEKENIKLVKTKNGTLEILNKDNIPRRNFTFTISNLDKRNDKFMEFIAKQSSLTDSLKMLVYEWLRNHEADDISNSLKIE